MTRQQKIFWGKTAAIFAVVPVLIYAYADGPDPGKSGVPGESLCTEAGCHVGTANTGPGSVNVTFPNGLTYTPGVTQHLVVTVSDPNQRRWGFQLTARQTSSNGKTQAGTFAKTDNNTQGACASTTFIAQTVPATNCPSSQPLMYIEHTLAGTRLGTTGGVNFEFDWTPPAANVGNITIYVAGNAANGDNNNTGDRIYSKTFTLTPSSGGGGGNKPVIQSGGVTNGASFQAGIVGGSWVTIKGTNLANIDDPGRLWRGDEIVGGRLPTSLDNVSVTINGKPAFVEFISKGQINVIAPIDTAIGPVQVVVSNNGVASDPFTANIQAVQPGIFMYNGTTAVATTPDFKIIGSIAGTIPTKPGDVIILWGTGCGPTNPAIPNGQVISGAPSLVNAPTVTIGGMNAPVVGAAMAPGFAGTYQIAVTVPNVGNGQQEVIVRSAGVNSLSGVTLNVQR
jgi:uncharacterized protein (TIGR03437 family)